MTKITASGALLLFLTVLSVLYSFAQEPADVSKAYLIEHAEELGITRSDAGSFAVSSSYQSKHNGLSHVILIQEHQGIEIFNSVLNIAIDKNGEVISAVGHPFKNAGALVNSTSPGINEQAAIQAAAAHLGLSITSVIEKIESQVANDRPSLWTDGGISYDPIPAKLVFQPVQGPALKLCWELVIQEKGGQNWWQIRVDAQSGEVLSKNNWISTCNWDIPHDHHACHTETKAASAPAIPLLPPNGYNIYALPVEAPTFGGRSILINPASAGTVASPFGWHDTNGSPGVEHTITRGNNVWAQEDQNGDNGTGFSPDGGATLDFDFPVDLNQAPATYVEAAITNLFYMNNVMHDVWYMYGFDEASGNFQENNYGNGGLGNDMVFADAQDGSGINNANFSSPPDGTSGRMQMFLWNIPSPPLFQVNSPGGIAGQYAASGADFGPQSANVTGNLVIADDGTANSFLGCNPLVNNNMAGNIALIGRGSCNFTAKVQNAQNAGAIAVVIANNQAGLFTMGGASGTITIPAIMIETSTRDLLLNELNNNNTVNVTINLSGNVEKDGDFDNGIIAHEYGHGISTRLTGGPDISSCLFNDEQMGEGWSDWFALMMTIEPGDAAADVRGIGTFAIGQGTSGGGIRTYPYSTDMNINPHTYNDIQVESVPHGVGSVWCAMLWDLTWELIDIYGFDPDLYEGTGGNNIAMQLVMDALKLQPCSPGFVDGRDAILLADEVNYGGIHQCLIWEVFARRGLGFSADQGSSSSRADGTEAFDLPPLCTLDIRKTGPSTAEAGNAVNYTLTITNASAQQVSGVLVTDVIPAELTYIPGSCDCSSNLNGATLEIPLGTMAPGEVVICNYSAISAPAPFSQISFEDDIESGTANFTTSSGVGSFNWSLNNQSFYSSNTSWFASNPGVQSDQYLVLTVPGAIPAGSVLSFWHNFNTELDWDGCVIEASTNGGGTWNDLGASITQNGYNGTLIVNAGSPLSGRPAWTGSSGGYVNTIVDLSSFAGQNIQIRFRIGTDEFVGAYGWHVDDIRISQQIVEATNNACVSSNEYPTYCVSVNTLITEPLCTPVNWFIDTDGDGFGSATASVFSCDQPNGYANASGDCDETNPQVYPGAPGTGEGIDNNCNGQIDPAESAGCEGDLNGDLEVNVQDLLLILGNFGCLSSCPFDLTGDGILNTADLVYFIPLYGNTCN